MESEGTKELGVVEKFKESLKRVEEDNKKMLEEVEVQISQLNHFVVKLDEGRERIEGAEFKIAQLAQKFNSS